LALSITKSGTDDSIVTFCSDTQVFTLKEGNVSNTYAFYDGSGYIFAASSSNNQLKTESSLSNNSSWKLTFDGNNVEIKAQGTNTINVIKYNSSGKVFSCYSTNQGNVSLYKVDAPSIPVTGVTLNKSSTSIQNGCTETLTATVSPTTATDKSVTWTSSSPFVASVDSNGVITALSEGNTTITVTTTDGGFTATCDVTVTKDEVASIEIDETKSKLSYLVDEQFNKNDIYVNVNYVHASSQELDNSELTFDITNTYTFTTSDISTGKTLTVSYTDTSGSIFTDSVDLSVSNPTGAIYSVSGTSSHTDVNVPEGSSATYYSSNGVQLPSSNYMTLTLTDYAGYDIKGISLLMRSNSSSGSGYVSVKANDTTIASIGDSSNPLSFDDEGFNGRFLTSYRYLSLSLSSVYAVQENDSIVIRIDSTENSLYCKGFNVVYEEHVEPEGNYVKVTSEPSNWEGTYLLVYESSTTSGVTWTGVDAGECNVAVTIIDNVIATRPDDAVTLSIYKYSTGYSVIVNGGENDGKFIYGTSGSNKINFTASQSTAGITSISFESNNTKLISNTSIMMYNSSIETGNSRFRYYKKDSTQKSVQLYKYSKDNANLIEAERYSISLNNCITCYSGSKTPTLTGKEWTDFSSEFSDLSTLARQYLVNATFTVSGTEVTPSGNTTQRVADGMAKYDQLVSRYPTSFNNFMERNVPTNNYSGSILVQISNSKTIVLVIVSFTSLLAVGGYFFLRHKKENA